MARDALQQLMADLSCPREAAMLESADIFRRYGPEYRAKFADRMPQSHLKLCRPSNSAGQRRWAGISPSVQRAGNWSTVIIPARIGIVPSAKMKKPRWLAQHAPLLLPVPYFLVTFTLPAELRCVARSHQQCLTTCSFKPLLPPCAGLA